LIDVGSRLIRYSTIQHGQGFRSIRNSEAVAAIKLKAQEHASNLRSILDDFRAQGTTSVRKIAEELNNRGILAPRGGEWQPTTVVRLLARLRMRAG
jgi:hypothetical protein